MAKMPEQTPAPCCIMTHWRVLEMSPSRRFAGLTLAVLLLTLSVSAQVGRRFEITVPADVHAQPITGRVYVIISRHNDADLRDNIGSWEQETPFFGTDVAGLEAGSAAVISSRTLGYPLRSLKEIPAGDYYVQALVNVYHRVSPCRWPRYLGPHGPMGGPAVQ